ncbi:hypothetical protein OIU80_06735 [Flavobacterium sp. LS1R47]|uniref:Tox-MPTase4 domain-containing protein n=1 Tax=Flavobacterium frigoritolerans TaxID=2987686 RepID=A0A9X2ZJ08_9FLAO|nr:zincin-like metallopeptidase toxin domain-containing protein [Flavobacterium frigoritolerans]MCV9931974.1 hypothetical protein [Flavobacterium frigoritolerans]
MIIKNHTIVLEDTSPAEMARFRQIMIGIWRQQIEDDKNTAEMEKYIKNSQISTSVNFIPVFQVIECIKSKINNVYPNTSFSQFIGSTRMSTPEKLGSIIYNDSQGAQKKGGVHLEWNDFNGINLITFSPSIEIGKYHTDFTLTIFDHDLKKIAFKFTVRDFDLYITLFGLLGVAITSDAQVIIDLYLKKIKEAKSDPNKLDVIYESLPSTLFGKMNDQELYKHLDLILKNISILEAIGTPTELDTNEDKAVLHILYAIKNREHLYTTLRDTDLLHRIYNKLDGEEVQDLLRFLTRLVGDFDKTKPTDIVYFDNAYYLFRDVHVKTNWSGGKIYVDNYKDKTELVGAPRAALNPKELDRMYPPGVQEIYLPQYFIFSKPFNPLAKLNFGTKLGDLGEQIGDENTFVIALKLHNMATKQSNWDWFDIATDFLSLVSAFGALRIVLAKGASLTARALAGVVLAKDVAHYVMLSNGTLENWHKNGYGWLANLWIAFSVTVDLASFGLPNLSRIAKEGNAAAEIAKTAEDAKEIRRVANEANRLVEAETGKDVSKMSEKEFEDLFDYLANWDGKPVSRRGYLGAKKLSKKEINVYIRKINKMSNGKSKLMVVPKGHEILQGNKAGFHPFSGTLYVEKGATEFEIFHEFKHFEEFKKIGLDEYLKGAVDISGNYVLDAIRTYKREKYVFDEIMKNKSKFNKAQIERAQEYMEEIITACRAYNIDVTKIK